MLPINLQTITIAQTMSIVREEASDSQSVVCGRKIRTEIIVMMAYVDPV